MLETLVLGEFSHELLLEFVLEAFLLGGALGLKSELEILCCLQLFAHLALSLGFGGLLGQRRLFLLLHIKLIAQPFLELLLSSAGLLFHGQLLQEGFARGFGLCLHALNLVLSILLFGGVTADHLILVLLKLVLARDERSLLIMGEDHISLRLLLFLLNNAAEFLVLLDHFLDHSVHLFFLSDVLGVRLCAHSFLLLDLPLDELLVVYEVIGLFCDEVAVVSVLVLLDFQVGCVDGCVLFEALLAAVLGLGRLGSTLFVEICMADVSLKLLEFVTLGTHLFNFALTSLVNNL